MQHEHLQVKRVVPAMLAAVGLAHDLGNSLDSATKVNRQFSSGSSANQMRTPQMSIFLSLTGMHRHSGFSTRFLQILNDHFGLNLTVGTLAALIKYPSVDGTHNRHGFKKYGVFASERDIANQVWSQTGLCEGIRHPLAYVMEACDDIAYSIIHAEDTVKKGYASF